MAKTLICSVLPQRISALLPAQTSKLTSRKASAPPDTRRVFQQNTLINESLNIALRDVLRTRGKDRPFD